MDTIITKEERTVVKRYDEDDSPGQLVVINDDYNTFEHVIKCLQEICKLPYEKASEYTLQIHLEGESIVLKDKKSVLHPACESLNENGLTAEIRDDESK